jgi:hypothetical protein
MVGNECWQRNYWSPMNFYSLQPRGSWEPATLTAVKQLSRPRGGHRGNLRDFASPLAHARRQSRLTPNRPFRRGF